MNLQIRPFNTSDLADILRLSVLAWVAEVGGQVVGFIVYELNHTSKVGEVQLSDSKNGPPGRFPRRS